jgi:CheY-like chemotaxis protein
MPKVLVVDDDASSREIIRMALECEDYQVDEAENGKVALELASHSEFDLLVTDIVMPEVDGIQFMYELHKTRPRLPIVAISGGALLSARNYLRIASQTGASAVLPKPFTLSQLYAAVRNCLEAVPRN